jgi:hypothetical protein
MGKARNGDSPHVIEAIVNHVSGSKAGVAGVYNRATYRPESVRCTSSGRRTQSGPTRLPSSATDVALTDRNEYKNWWTEDLARAPRALEEIMELPQFGGRKAYCARGPTA